MGFRWRLQCYWQAQCRALRILFARERDRRRVFRCRGFDVSAEAKERGIEGMDFVTAGSAIEARREVDALLRARGLRGFDERPYEIIALEEIQARYPSRSSVLP